MRTTHVHTFSYIYKHTIAAIRFVCVYRTPSTLHAVTNRLHILTKLVISIRLRRHPTRMPDAIIAALLCGRETRDAMVTDWQYTKHPTIVRIVREGGMAKINTRCKH